MILTLNREKCSLGGLDCARPPSTALAHPRLRSPTLDCARPPSTSLAHRYNGRCLSGAESTGIEKTRQVLEADIRPDRFLKPVRSGRDNSRCPSRAEGTGIEKTRQVLET